jgi:hypothetical protein
LGHSFHGKSYAYFYKKFRQFIHETHLVTLARLEKFLNLEIAVESSSTAFQISRTQCDQIRRNFATWKKHNLVFLKYGQNFEPFLANL